MAANMRATDVVNEDGASLRAAAQVQQYISNVQRSGWVVEAEGRLSLFVPDPKKLRVAGEPRQPRQRELADRGRDIRCSVGMVQPPPDIGVFRQQLTETFTYLAVVVAVPIARDQATTLDGRDEDGQVDGEPAVQIRTQPRYLRRSGRVKRAHLEAEHMDEAVVASAAVEVMASLPKAFRFQGRCDVGDDSSHRISGRWMPASSLRCDIHDRFAPEPHGSGYDACQPKTRACRRPSGCAGEGVQGLGARVHDQFMATPSASVRIVGGVNMPTMYLRMNATWPLAVLTITGSRVSIRLPGPLQRTGGVPLDASPAEIAEVFPTRSMWSRGVGFTDRAGRQRYFWTRRVQPILTMLDERGYPVTTVPQKAAKVWNAVP